MPAVLAVLLCGPAACGGGASPDPPEVGLGWRQVTLPAPAGGPGRPVLRDAAACGDRWYVVGATIDAGGNRPAAWQSWDGESWRAVTLKALPASLYGARSTIYSLACHDGRVAAVGAASGGVHGNPRVSTWRLDRGGALVEVESAFEVYGGPDAVNVARIAAGSSGFAIAGNRTSGAAVWLSGDGTGFRLVQNAPGLASGAGMSTSISDVAVSGSQLTVVGGVRRAGRTDGDPAAWRSADGAAWARTDLPDGADAEALQRVLVSGDALVAFGPRAAGFGSWRTVGDTWQAAGRFGRAAAGGIAEVRSVTAAGRWLVVAADDGAAYGVWLSSDGARSWTAGSSPVAQRSGADRSMAVAGLGTRLVLVADDAARATVWVVDLP